MPTLFNDHFSSTAEEYRSYRPQYPEELFAYLAKLSPSRNRAWDCATGTGQASIPLAQHYDEVYATDASKKQLSEAPHATNIIYKLAPAEDSGLSDNSMDLITAAQALHWFNLSQFTREVERVLLPSGILAAWTYNLLTISPEIDNLITDFYNDVVGPYWPPERKMVENGYHNILFPFKTHQSPEFKMEQDWSLYQLLGYLGTWSAVNQFKKKHKSNPVETIFEELSEHWGTPTSTKHVIWPLTLRIWVK